MSLPVKSMEFIVMLPARALSARTWSPMGGEAVPALIAWGASSLQAVKSATVGTSPSAVREAASETRRVRARVTTTLSCRAMAYSFQEHPKKGNKSRHPYRVVTRQEAASLVIELQEPRHPPTSSRASTAPLSAWAFSRPFEMSVWALSSRHVVTRAAAPECLV